MSEESFICSTCGRKVGFSKELAPCEMLIGWLTLAHWKGLSSVDHYNFCSLSCLKKWVNTKVPEIPRVFLDSFNDESGE